MNPMLLPALAFAQACASEDCTSCRTNNFYYVLALAIIVFVIFFWWTNRNRVPKRPRRKGGKE